MKSIIRIAIFILYLISFQLQTNAQDLPLVCGGSKARYAVTGNLGSTYNWQVVGGVILQNYNDSIDIQWNDDLLAKNISVTEQTSACVGLPATATVPVSAPKLELGSDLKTCSNIPLLFQPEPDTLNYSFLWNTGITKRDITLTKAGMYILKMTDKVSGCSAVDSVALTLTKVPSVNLGPDSILCNLLSYTLDGGSDGIKYDWLNYRTKAPLENSNNQEFLEIDPNNMSSNYIAVIVENIDGCTNSDSVHLHSCAEKNIPNAFTPNDDGDNDTWKLVYLLEHQKASIEIFDRWGRKIFHCGEGGFPTQGWDGTQNGRKLPMDTYFYVIKPNDGSDILSGGVTIIR